MSRRYLTEEEYNSLPNIVPPGVETELDRKQIFRVHGPGKAKDQSGAEVEVGPDWFVKVLPEAVQEDWCYQVISLVVVRAGFPVELRPGVPVAFLPEGEVLPQESAS